MYRTETFLVKTLDKIFLVGKNRFVGFGYQRMKIEGNAKNLPTFRQWRKDNPGEDSEGNYPIEIIWESDDYRTITFQTQYFRVPVKYKTLDELNTVHSELMKLSKKPVWAAVVVGEDMSYLVEVSPASDANECPQKMSWVRKMNAFEIE